MTDQEVLELLRRIDNGYEPSEEERRVLSSIDKINWRYIDELPESIGNLTSLQYLDLSETEVSELPENLCNIQNLQRLDLCETYIRELPKSMCNLTSLQRVDLSYTPISELSDSLGNLRSLQSLNLSATKIRELPESLCNLTSLGSLDLSSTQISKLPESVCNLTSLQTLNLSSTKIRELPKSVCNLTSLQFLDIGNTQISELPESVCNLTSLQFLNIGNTQIRELPESVCNLTSLLNLDLSSTQVGELPESLCNLTSLQTLNLSTTQISELPESLCNLKYLQSLYIGFSQISELPESACNLKNLQFLDLSFTRISKLPKSLWKLRNLKSLHLLYTQMSELPDNIGYLPSLKYLYFGHTPISELPESVCNLTNLRSLDLSSTQISELPENVCNLTSLQTLDLSSTQVSELPESLGNLTNLQSLNLSFTLIRELPESIGHLPNLKKLGLQDNSLSGLCEDLLYLNLGYEYIDDYSSLLSERGIYIHGLKLQKQPVSLFWQSRELIKKYYESEKVDLKEAKVIFMGDGGAGKSYTIQRIKNKGKRLDKDTEVTHDIVIECWDNSDHIVDYDGTIDFWDFGGQDIYLSMHRCFLTERSCYVIVLCNRQYGSHRGLIRQARYWLKNISAFANDSPILIAVNTWSGQSRDGLSLTQLKKEFPKLNIVDQIVYNAHDSACEEFNRLTSRICKMAQENYSYGLQFPVSWNNIRTRLLNGYSKENLISESEYYRICKEEMTGHDGYYEEEIARWLLHWFNDLGYCFNYHDIDGKSEGEEYQVLKPQWVIRAMYRIINHKIRCNSGDEMPQAETLPQELAESKRDRDGWISKDDVVDLLKEESESGDSYSEQEAEYIIRILRKFKLAYLVKDSGVEYLFVPALCTDRRRDTFDKVDPNFTLKTEYLIRFEHLPDTVMQHLMIKCYQEGRRLKEVWKNGFHLRVTDGIIVVEMFDDTEIVIKFYESAKTSSSYGLHEMREWLSDIYKDLGIENTKDYIIKRSPRQTAFINVKALVNAYIKNPKMDLFYSQDDDVYEGHSVDDLLRGLYSSNYREIIEEEVKRRKERDIEMEMEPVDLSKNIINSDIADIIEERFRTQFIDPPKDEKEVQVQLQKFLDAQGYKRGRDYERESGKLKFSGREYIPDFVLINSKSVIEVKIIKDKSHKNKMIEEMNADYSAYTKKYNSIIYLVYDLGIISDVPEFKRDFEAKGNVKVIVIKH